jgi:deoxycytidylate deaminase
MLIQPGRTVWRRLFGSTRYTHTKPCARSGRVIVERAIKKTITKTVFVMII